MSEALLSDPPPAPVPSTLEAVYRSRVRSWMPEHPFVGATRQEFASPVFGDYVRGRVLHGGSASARDGVRARTADATYRPTEMLARFFFQLPNGTPIGPDDLAVLYESLLAAEDAGQPVHLVLAAAVGEARHVGGIRIGDREFIPLDVASDSGPLRFYTRLSSANIFTSSPVQLGAHGRLLELGPDTVILAPRVEVLAESILVKASGDDRVGAFVRCGQLTASDHVIRFVLGEKHFAVQANEPLRYPFADKAVQVRWNDLRLPLKQAEEESARALFQLAGMFKTEGYKAGLGAYTEGIDRMAGRSDPIRRVLEAATAQQIITREGHIYKFHPHRLNLNYQAVQTHDLSDEAYEFVKSVTR